MRATKRTAWAPEKPAVMRARWTANPQWRRPAMHKRGQMYPVPPEVHNGTLPNRCNDGRKGKGREPSNERMRMGDANPTPKAHKREQMYPVPPEANN